MISKKFLFCIIIISQHLLPNFCLSDSATEIKIDKYALGQSLLDYYSSSQIKKMIEKKLSYKNRNEYFQISSGFKTQRYDEIFFWIKRKDKNHIIQSIGGAVYCNKEKDCDKDANKIYNDIKASLGVEFKQSEQLHSFDNKSRIKGYFHTFEDQSFIAIQTYIWDKKTKKKYNWTNTTSVELFLPEFARWIQNAD